METESFPHSQVRRLHALHTQAGSVRVVLRSHTGVSTDGLKASRGDRDTLCLISAETGLHPLRSLCFFCSFVTSMPVCPNESSVAVRISKYESFLTANRDFNLGFTKASMIFSPSKL